jgi:hypothetical protein
MAVSPSRMPTSLMMQCLVLHTIVRYTKSIPDCEDFLRNGFSFARQRALAGP